MNKEYQAPEVELITLAAEEAITTGDGIVGGEMGTESSIF